MTTSLRARSRSASRWPAGPALAAVALAFATVAGAQPGPAAAPLLARLEAARRGLRTFTGEFVQRKQMALFATTIETRGRIAVRLPDRLRWETLGDDAAVYVASGDRLAYRSGAGSGEVRAGQAGAMGAVVRDLATLLGGSLRSLERRYELRGEGDTLVVVPRDPAVRRTLLRLRATFSGPRLLPTRLELEEPGGDHTTIELRALRVNVPVAEREFQLD